MSASEAERATTMTQAQLLKWARTVAKAEHGAAPRDSLAKARHAFVLATFDDYERLLKLEAAVRDDPFDALGIRDALAALDREREGDAT
jgi:hypothetical protein